ncbi:MAG: alkene reductase [Thermodesulfobacteriota bacterium]
MPNTDRPDLFTPLLLGSLTLPNRMIMAPMTRNRAAKGNVPQPLNATYYSQRATAGLIITEASQVSPQGVGYPFTPGIHNQDQVSGWKLVTSAVHQAGGRIFLQLWHVGRISHPSLQPGNALPVAPSAIAPSGSVMTYQGLQPFVTPRALAEEEIPGVVDQYRKAAVQAREAGFDGVEIHGANGYLPDQFLRSGSNKRNDSYGGTLENRARFLLSAVDAVCESWDSHRVGVRISPLNSFNSMSDDNPDETFGYVADKLSPRNLAYLHVVEAAAAPGAPGCDFAALRKRFRGVYMANSGYDKKRATEALAAGRADCVSFGAPFIGNPDLVRRFREDAPLNASDRATFYGGDAHGYTDYPFLNP